MINCGQTGANFKDLNGNGATAKEPKKSDCGCSGDAANYEPLTRQWFSEWAPIIALVISLLALLKN